MKIHWADPITNINIIQQSYSMVFQTTSYVILLLFMYATFQTYFFLNFTLLTILSKQNKYVSDYVVFSIYSVMNLTSMFFGLKYSLYTE